MSKVIRELELIAYQLTHPKRSQYERLQMLPSPPVVALHCHLDGKKNKESYYKPK